MRAVRRLRRRSVQRLHDKRSVGSAPCAFMRCGISRGAPTMTATPQTVDEYLAPSSDDKRAALEKLRRAIRSAAPEAEECICYQIPAYRLGGRLLVAFGAAARHCAFY